MQFMGLSNYKFLQVKNFGIFTLRNQKVKEFNIHIVWKRLERSSSRDIMDGEDYCLISNTKFGFH